MGLKSKLDKELIKISCLGIHHQVIEQKLGLGSKMAWLQIILTPIENDPTIVTDVMALIGKVVNKNPAIVAQVATAVKASTK